VQVKKSDAVVQLEEVETCTGEEDETTAFQVRAKLFVLGAPTEDNKDGDDDQKEGSPSKVLSLCGCECVNMCRLCLGVSVHTHNKHARTHRERERQSEREREREKMQITRDAIVYDARFM
jgi:hypothetical protein